MTDHRLPLGPPPIEPLSDAAWSRVERGVWSRLDAGQPARPVIAPARRRWLLALPVLAAAAAVAVLVVRRPDIAIAPPDDPSRVVSGEAPSSISFADAHIELAPDTALMTSHDGGRPVAMLEHGSAWFTVAPRGERPAFVVRAGDAAIRVIGTRFRVARSGEQLAVEVDHGRVEVAFRGTAVTIAAHQQWTSNAPGEVSTVAAAQPASDASAASSAATDADAAASTAAAIEPPPAPAPPRPHPAGSSHTRHAERAAEPAAAAPIATDRDRAEYERLAALEAAHADQALTGYLTLARSATRWGELAAYAAGRLAADRHDRRAAPLLESYLQRFPHGANAADAQQLLAHLREAP